MNLPRMMEGPYQCTKQNRGSVVIFVKFMSLSKFRVLLEYFICNNSGDKIFSSLTPCSCKRLHRFQSVRWKRFYIQEFVR